MPIPRVADGIVVSGPRAALPRSRPLVALAVPGMNDVLNSQGYTQAAWWNRIPAAAWALMAAIAVCSSFLVGYGSHNTREAARLLVVLPLIASIAFMLIADIDAPLHGLITVRPREPDQPARVTTRALDGFGSARLRIRLMLTQRRAARMRSAIGRAPCIRDASADRLAEEVFSRPRA